jgi:uncharacterized RDD family membrane protein YckC
MDTSVTDGAQDLAIAGFWRRIGAFFIDVILLGIIGQVIGLLLYGALTRMGAPARLIGFVIALAYFGIFNSYLGKGQTLANRWLGIRVVDAHGQPLSLPLSLLRYTVLGVPFFLNGLPLPMPLLMSPIIGTLLAVLVFGGGFAIIYLYLFNRRTRQSLHDLVVGSYVVRVQPEANQVHFATVWRGHLVVTSVIILLTLAAPIVGKRLTQTDLFAGLIPLYQTLEIQPHVMNAQVQRGWQSFNGQPAIHDISAQLRLDTPMTDDAGYARGVAQVLVKGDPHLAQEDVVKVVLYYGYDIGIASWWNRHNYSFKPQELQ